MTAVEPGADVVGGARPRFKGSDAIFDAFVVDLGNAFGVGRGRGSCGKRHVRNYKG